jgi:hypothetical protein
LCSPRALLDVVVRVGQLLVRVVQGEPQKPPTCQQRVTFPPEGRKLGSCKLGRLLLKKLLPGREQKLAETPPGGVGRRQLGGEPKLVSLLTHTGLHRAEERVAVLAFANTSHQLIKVPTYMPLSLRRPHGRVSVTYQHRSHQRYVITRSSVRDDL